MDEEGKQMNIKKKKKKYASSHKYLANRFLTFNAILAY